MVPEVRDDLVSHFLQIDTPFDAISSEPNFPDGQYKLYQQPELGPNRFRMITTLGGYVFGTAPSEVGDFVLQAGRIED